MISLLLNELGRKYKKGYSFGKLSKAVKRYSDEADSRRIYEELGYGIKFDTHLIGKTSLKLFNG